MKVFRGYAVLLDRYKYGVRGGKKGLLGEIRMVIGAKLQHDKNSLCEIRSVKTVMSLRNVFSILISGE
jgi:hypothetical protein